MSEDYGRGYKIEEEDVIKFLRRMKYNLTHPDGLRNTNDAETMQLVIEHVQWCDGYIAGASGKGKPQE